MLRLTDKLLDTLPLVCLVQVVEKCTRHCQGRKSSLIDQVWLNNVLKHVVTKTITTDLDHDLVVRTLKTAGEATWQEAGVKRCYKNFNRDEYLLELMSLTWTDVYNC